MSSDNKFSLNEIKPHPDRTPSRAKSDAIDMTEDIPNAIPQKDGTPEAHWAMQPSTSDSGAPSIVSPAEGPDILTESF